METEKKQRAEKKCPYCAEMILAEAIRCRYCQADLVSKSEQKEPERPGLFKVMFFNLLCPGYGAWKLGLKWRGLIILFAVMGFLTAYAAEVIPKINHRVEMAVRTGRAQDLKKLDNELKENSWGEMAFYAYLLSFVDLYFLVKNSSDEKKSKEKNEKA